MTSIGNRLKRVEKRFGYVNGEQTGFRVILSRGGLALDEDACVTILREGGFLRFHCGISMVDLTRVPEGLTADETRRFLREHGAEVCGGSCR